MTKFILAALVATVAMTACAPKSHHEEGKSSATKPPVQKPTSQGEGQAEVNPPTTQPAPATDAKAPDVAAPQAKAPEAPTVDAKAPAAPAAQSSAAQDEQIPIFGQDFVCTDAFLSSFPPFEKAFADAAKATDQAMVAMKPVVERLDDSGGYHAKVLENYQALTTAYKTMLKQFGTTFGCFYMLPKGHQIKITSDTFKTDYERLRARVGEMIGTQHLGPEINDI